MVKRIVILGGGTGGTLVANRLRRSLDRETVEIVVVDQDNSHVYQPGLLFIPFAMTTADAITRPRERQFHPGIRFHRASIERVDVEHDQVILGDGVTLDYDILIVATGAILLPEETEGLAGPVWMDRAFTFYDLEGAVALHQRLESFPGGRLVVNVVDTPIKCPVAPLEFCFLADWYFQQRGIRDKVDLVYVTPLDGAFTKPVASRTLGNLLEQKGIQLVTDYNTATVDGSEGRLISFDDREVSFDLAVMIPAHGGAAYVGASPGLGDALGYIETDKYTLQSKVKDNIFALGDAAGIPASKAGSVPHFEGDVLVTNIMRFLAGQTLDARFDGHTNCFIESGFHKALLIDFNYDTEPLTGHYPTDVGLPLLKESHLNHLGKLMFQTFYWHSLLPGHDVPGVGSAMPLRGKHLEATPH
ncbi:MULTISPECIES: type III sulfide quinone reductase, selenoprotein subtype [Ferrimicrobium]|uniref:FAD/NAD(P)-binding oxidoreductase n=1 Tax=Ferrimicrobium acidiphilum TaxID=121039 RepID=A0ABV3Y430_9ACTN|nr:FAD/NAD(P)-binding oxidoreductase [Ferrimicrobium sp.]MCL5052748.1 NAD(P)/FAD-dependent oxidoreductase [Gammaproteobacteria bacterium]